MTAPDRASECLFFENRQSAIGHFQRQPELLILSIRRFDISRHQTLEDDEGVGTGMLKADQIPALLSLGIEEGLQLLASIILRGWRSLTGVLLAIEPRELLLEVGLAEHWTPLARLLSWPRWLGGSGLCTWCGAGCSLRTFAGSRPSGASRRWTWWRSGGLNVEPDHLVLPALHQSVRSTIVC